MEPIVAIISDCKDQNAEMRLSIRAQSLLKTGKVNFSGVQNEYEMGGNIIDSIDAALGEKLVVLANVAPRSGDGANGVPFVWTRIHDAWIFMTGSRIAMDMIHKIFGFQRFSTIHFSKLDVPGSLLDTQFRSYELLPRFATAALKGEIYGELCDEESQEGPSALHRPTVSSAVWFVDEFGNLKTTVLPQEIHFEVGKKYRINFSSFQAVGYPRLCDVPPGVLGLVPGSSGYGVQRWLELVVGGREPGGAAKVLSLQSGSMIALHALAPNEVKV